MRITLRVLVTALVFAARVVAQAESDPDETGPDPDSEPEPEPEPPSVEPTTSFEPNPVTSQAPVTHQPEITATSTIIDLFASTTAPPIAGGADCVQTCLTDTAVGFGCSNGANWGCVCAESDYREYVASCFAHYTCQASAVGNALRDYDAMCRAILPVSGKAASALSPHMTTIAPGAVITVSGFPSTVTSGFAALQTGYVIVGGNTSMIWSQTKSGTSNTDSSMILMAVGLGVVGAMLAVVL